MSSGLDFLLRLLDVHDFRLMHLDLGRCMLRSRVVFSDKVTVTVTVTVTVRGGVIFTH